MTTPSSNGRHKTTALNRHLANRAIHRRTDLMSGAKDVLLIIADKAGHGSSTCTASYDTIASMTGKKRRWTICITKRLAKDDWVTIERRRCTKRGDLANEIRMGPQFVKAVEEQLVLEREQAEKKRLNGYIRQPNLVQLLDRGAFQCTPGVHSSARGECIPVHPNDSVLTTPENGKTTTTLSGRAAHEAKTSSSSSFAALQNESGGTGGPSSEALDPVRLDTTVRKLVSLKLKLDANDPGPMDPETAERVIREAAGESMEALRHVAWAIKIAGDRASPIKGKKRAETWRYVESILENWLVKDRCPRGWPEDEARAKRDAVSNARA